MFGPVIGHEKNIESFLRAMSSRRFHHAWLFHGPKGIGKGLLARNLAALLLGAERDSGSSFQVKKGRVTDLMSAGSHPDFRLLEKTESETGRPRQDIPVDDLRKLLQFFTLKPALGGRRVAIIDSLDEMNPSGSNALLKTLEEPPKDTVLFLIYHGKSGLLPTIRSRCQRLLFHRLDDDALRSAIATSDFADTEPSQELLRLSAGSPGQAKTFLENDCDLLLETLGDFCERAWPNPSPLITNRLLSLMAQSESLNLIAMQYLEQWCLARLEEDLDVSLKKKISVAWQETLLATGRANQLKLDLTERSAMCLSKFRALAREYEIQNAV